MSYRIGIDVGGTFTDLFLWSSDGAVETFKMLSTPEGSLAGGARRPGSDRRGSAGSPWRPSRRRSTTIVHGTTVTTNAVLTRGGAKTGLLTTEGVRDALEMRRGIREEQYNNRYLNVVPLVPRYLRQEVEGRLDYRGEELDAAGHGARAAAIGQLKAEGVEAVAICFMNAFANPAHERAAPRSCRRSCPTPTSASPSEVLPHGPLLQPRLHHRPQRLRGPVLDDYLESLTAKLAGVGFGGVLLIMQSNGGVALPEVIRRGRPPPCSAARAGGPARGGGLRRGPRADDDCILVDMGGTSFDASLVRGGAAAMASEGEIDRLRIALPMLDDHHHRRGRRERRLDRRGRAAAHGAAVRGRAARARLLRPRRRAADLHRRGSGAGLPRSRVLRRRQAAAGRRTGARKAIETHIAEPLGLDVEEAAAGHVPRDQQPTWPTACARSPSSAGSTRASSRWWWPAARARCTPA